MKRLQSCVLAVNINFSTMKIAIFCISNQVKSIYGSLLVQRQIVFIVRMKEGACAQNRKPQTPNSGTHQYS